MGDVNYVARPDDREGVREGNCSHSAHRQRVHVHVSRVCGDSCQLFLLVAFYLSNTEALAANGRYREIGRDAELPCRFSRWWERTRTVSFTIVLLHVACLDERCRFYRTRQVDGYSKADLAKKHGCLGVFLLWKRIVAGTPCQFARHSSISRVCRFHQAVWSGPSSC